MKNLGPKELLNTLGFSLSKSLANNFVKFFGDFLCHVSIKCHWEKNFLSLTLEKSHQDSIMHIPILSKLEDLK